MHAFYGKATSCRQLGPGRLEQRGLASRRILALAKRSSRLSMCLGERERRSNRAAGTSKRGFGASGLAAARVQVAPVSIAERYETMTYAVDWLCTGTEGLQRLRGERYQSLSHVYHMAALSYFSRKCLKPARRGDHHACTTRFGSATTTPHPIAEEQEQTVVWTRKH